MFANLAQLTKSQEPCPSATSIIGFTPARGFSVHHWNVQSVCTLLRKDPSPVLHADLSTPQIATDPNVSLHAPTAQSLISIAQLEILLFKAVPFASRLAGTLAAG